MGLVSYYGLMGTNRGCSAASPALSLPHREVVYMRQKAGRDVQSHLTSYKFMSPYNIATYIYVCTYVLIYVLFFTPETRKLRHFLFSNSSHS